MVRRASFRFGLWLPIKTLDRAMPGGGIRMTRSRDATASGPRQHDWRQMNLRKTSLIALGIGALAIPAAAVADPGHGHGHGHGPGGSHGHGHGHNPTVMYVFKGTFGDQAADPGAVAVDHGNGRVRKGGLVDTTVHFDFASAKLVVADTTGDGTVALDDVQTGDRVVVKARLPKQDPGAQPFVAKQLVDQTNSGDDDTGDDSGDDD